MKRRGGLVNDILNYLTNKTTPDLVPRSFPSLVVFFYLVSDKLLSLFFEAKTTPDLVPRSFPSLGRRGAKWEFVFSFRVSKPKKIFSNYPTIQLSNYPTKQLTYFSSQKTLIFPREFRESLILH